MEQQTGKVVEFSRNPYRVETVRCAVCRRVKEETNHWYQITTIGRTFISEPLEARDLEDGGHPVCGYACAQKKYETFLRTGKL